jgi:hypothetical protein
MHLVQMPNIQIPDGFDPPEHGMGAMHLVQMPNIQIPDGFDPPEHGVGAMHLVQMPNIQMVSCTNLRQSAQFGKSLS